jgi:predicted nucleic acid-binding protein
MQVIDASSMIHAWDTYPIRQFPGLWKWLAIQVEEGKLMMSQVALEEVGYKVPECRKWLVDCGVERLEVDNTVLDEAVRIKGLLGIIGDSYSPKGVDENDILIIATAVVRGSELVSDEGKQTVHPLLAKNRKIPAVCAMNEVSVLCINFIDFIKRSGVVFG